LFTPRSETCARFLLQTAVDAIAFYKRRFGLYPYRSLTIIPGSDEPVGGYNPATAIVAIHGQEKMADRPKLFWKWITAHEIGHQYWGEYVLEKDDPGWVWIGMGIYTDREYFRARGLSLDQHKEVMGRYIAGVRDHLDTTVTVTRDQREDIEFDFNNVVTHGKGFSIISALAEVVGQDNFDRIQRRCLAGFAGRRLGMAELRSVAELESGQDLGWFFSQWAQSNRFLAYDIASQESSQMGEQYATKVIVRRVGSMRMPVPVRALFVDGTQQVKISDPLLDQNTLQFTSTASLKEVQLDPQGNLAMVLPPPGPPPPPTTEEGLQRRIRRLGWPGSGEDALPLFQATKGVKLADAWSWFKLGMVLGWAPLAGGARIISPSGADSRRRPLRRQVWRPGMARTHAGSPGRPHPGVAMLPRGSCAERRLLHTPRPVWDHPRPQMGGGTDCNPFPATLGFAYGLLLTNCRQAFPYWIMEGLPVTRASSRLRQRFAVRCYRLQRPENDAGPCDPCVRIRSMGAFRLDG
jgi:hypothetical protein